MSGHGRLCAGSVLLALVTGICGCASTPNQWPFAWTKGFVPRWGARSPGDELKNPVGLQMAYARMQEQAGNSAEARKSYESVLGENPKSVDAVLGLARLDQLAGRVAEAEQGYQRAFELAPEDPQVLDTVGQFFAERKQWGKAIEILNRAVTTAPDNATIRHHLAIAMAHHGTPDAALTQFSRTVGDAAAHYNVALILYEQGKVEQAQQHLLQAVVIQPDLSEAQYWLDEIRREQETKELLKTAANPGQRRQEITPPKNDPESGSQKGIQLVRGQRSVATSARPPQVSPSPESQMSATAMTPQQLEQWRNSMTPQQFEQWRNQLD